MTLLVAPVQDQNLPRSVGGDDHRVEELLLTSCADCHGGATPEAKLAFDGPPDSFPTDVLRRMRSQIRSGTMPPESWPPLQPDERRTLLDWIEGRLRDAAGPSDPGRVPLRRLSAEEYRRTVRALLGVDVDRWVVLPADTVTHGFEHLANPLDLPPDVLETYAVAAERVATAAILDLHPQHGSIRRSPEQWDCSLETSTRRGLLVLFTRATATMELELPWSGRYRLTVTAAADSAGDEAAQLVLEVPGHTKQQWPVTATAEHPAEFALELDAKAGPLRVLATFPNDFYQPEHADPTKRDRNLHVGELTITALDPPVFPAAQREMLERDLPEAEWSERFAAMLRPFAEQACRRPPDEVTLESLCELAAVEADRQDSVHRGLRIGVQALLTSPSFLLHVERGLGSVEADGTVALDDWSVAARLSYFLWSAPPDETLHELAAAGRLRDPTVLAEQADRMLADARSSALAENFAAAWLEIENLSALELDPARFPEYDAELRADMRRETELFFESIVRENRPLRELIGARYSFVNERLASLYGLVGVRGPHLRRVALDGPRGGLLTQASILTVTSNPTRTSPVKRGKWILDVLLGEPPPPPPPNVPPLKESGEIAEQLSLRQQLERHRADPTCAVCHVRMDAFGLALENFDAIGRLRTRDGAHAIDPRSELPDGRVLDGIEDLRQELMTDDSLVRNVCTRLMLYALGRELGEADLARVERFAAEVDPASVTIRDIIQRIVQEDSFLRRTETPSDAERTD